MMRLFHHWVKYWYCRCWWRWLLWPLSLIYQVVLFFRRGMYQCGFIARYRPPIPVIVVGNITVGGTGKTPLVLSLAERLAAMGWRPVIICRGYGGRLGSQAHCVMTDDTAVLVGDEAKMMHDRGICPVVVSHDRADAVRYCLANELANIIISDDGLQHYRLQRDIEIEVVDHARRYGNGMCIPAGPLRAPRSLVDQVDYRVVRGGVDPEYWMFFQPVYLRSLKDPRIRQPLAYLHEREWVAIAGIGQPQQFFDGLTALGVQFTGITFPDHHHYTQRDIDAISGQALIMTEKDAVKCSCLSGIDDAWILIIDVQLPEQFWHSLEQRLSATLVLSSGE